MKKARKDTTARDLLDAPAYRIREAAYYLLLSEATIRSWVLGRDYRVAGIIRRFQPIIEPADREGAYLSFSNLVEAHVLAAIRRKHGISLDRVRMAIEYLRERLGSPRPLLEQQFVTDGVDLFVEKLGILLNASKDGQVGIKEILQLHLKRIDRDSHGVPIRLFPFTHSRPEQEAHRTVVIDPGISFGRPAISRLGVPTSIIAERYKAGDTIADLMTDYGAERDEIEEAIRCELAISAA